MVVLVLWLVTGGGRREFERQTRETALVDIQADEIVEGRKRRICLYNPNGKLFAQADEVRGVVLTT